MKITLLAAFIVAFTTAGSATALPVAHELPADSTRTKAVKLKKVDRSLLLAPPDDSLMNAGMPAKKPAKKGTTAKKPAKATPAIEYSDKARKDSVAHKEHSSGVHATYPGGDVAIMRFVRANMRYPQECKSRRLTGRVEVAMTIAPSGKITGIKLHSCSGNKYMDAEALRVAGTIPQWTPAQDTANGEELEYIVTFIFRPGR